MKTQQKKPYCYTTTISPYGTKKGVYLGKASSPQGKRHQQNMEEKKTRKAHEEELQQLNQELETALKLLKIMERGYLLVAGYYERKSEIRPLPLQEGHDVS